MQDEEKYSWVSYTSFGLGTFSFVVTVLFFLNALPGFYLKLTVYLVPISVPVSIVLGVLALRKKSEKRLLANIGITLGLIIGITLFCIIGFAWLITPVHPN
ncbi:hypothetical protein CFK37_19330 [Virgibacillus phasianinus]|uniref:Uncharacterized protein n=1 Tax=Virgibacillus phasianinus TaxID=2017483 RepID=A0A220U7S2_9BACI|nr:hypothetical protein [Virgibacillus phasianinus]ASK64150.1 hypothetical protein CFK37_19330 [Virgibacillus phasianinus]